MRAVYRLLGLVRRYGPAPVEAACERSLDLDVVSVSKIASMLEKAREREQPTLPAAAGSTHNTQGGRFARTPNEYGPPNNMGHGGVQLTLIPGGTNPSAATTTTPEEHS